MDPIVLLSRGPRHSALFAEIAKDLSSEFEVHVAILGAKPFCSFEEEARYFKHVPNITLHHLSKEFDQAWSDLKTKDQREAAIKKIEGELDLPLYHAASNYILYRRFSKEYFKGWHGLYDDEELLKKEFVGAYTFFNRLFSMLQPRMVFCEMPDLVSHRVATALAFKLGIFETHVNLIGAMGLNGFFLASGTNNKNPLLEFYFKNPQFLPKKKSASGFQIQKSQEVEENPYIGELRTASKNYWNRLASAKISQLKPKRLPEVCKRELSRVKKLRWLEKNLKKELPEEPYILFMLHHQPEATTLLCAPQWADQNHLVEQLAVHAPSGFKIVVKENPRTYGLRGKEYFGTLASLPNIHLLHPSFDNALTLRKCAGMVVITGTSGLEGILLKKKVAALVSNYYSFYPGVKKIEQPSEIFNWLTDKEWKPEDLEEELSHFQEAFLKSYRPMGKTLKGSPWPEPKPGGKIFGDSLREFIATVKQHGLKPETFGVQG